MCQLELFEKEKHVRIISTQGHQLLYLLICDLKEFIVNQTKKSRLWLYVDGIQINPSEVSSDIISSAKDIILTKPLVGG
jgi:hypothetical protein